MLAGQPGGVKCKRLKRPLTAHLHVQTGLSVPLLLRRCGSLSRLGGTCGRSPATASAPRSIGRPTARCLFRLFLHPTASGCATCSHAAACGCCTPHLGKNTKCGSGAILLQMKAGAVDQEFETMLAELRAWRDAYGTTLVPKQARVPSAVHMGRLQCRHGG